LPQPVLLVAGTFLLLLAAFAARRALVTARLMRDLRTMRAEPIAQLSPGFRQARGRIVADKTIPSAFHKRACVYYAYRVEEPALGAQGPKRLAVGKDWGEASLEDASGRAQIHHRPALIRAPHESVTQLDMLRQIPPEHAEFFEAAGIAAKHLARFQSLRIVEYTLEPGDEVHVTGWIGDDEEGKLFYRARRSPLVVSAQADTGLVPGLRNELLLFGVAAALLGAFSLLFFGVAFA
jgi:hypothetical protein